MRIVTPENDVFAGEAEYLSVNTPSGREGFMRGALPKAAVLSEGRVEISDGDERKIFMCGNGIICVDKEGITLITSDCIDAQNVDGSDFAADTEQRQDDYAKARLISAVSKTSGKRTKDDK